MTFDKDLAPPKQKAQNLESYPKQEHKLGPDLLNKMQEFANFLKENEKIIICHHVDADGLTSLLLLMHWLAQIHRTTLTEIQKKVKTFAVNNGDRSLEPSQYNQLEELKKQGFSAIVFADLNPRDRPQLNNLIINGWKLANIDHHFTDTTVDGLLIANPRITSDFVTDPVLDKLSTSSLIWQYGTALNNYSLNDADGKLLQIARVGNKGDNSTFLDEFELPPTSAESEIITLLAHILNILGTSEWYNISPDERDRYVAELFNKLLTAPNLTEAISALTQDKKYEEILKKIKYITQEISDLIFDDKPTTNPNLSIEKYIKVKEFNKSKKKLIICQLMDEELDLTALLVKNFYDLLNNQANLKQETFIVFIQPSRDGESKIVMCSNIDLINLGSSATKLGEKYGTGGGGHPKRAGLSIRNGNLTIVIQELKNLI